MYRIVRNGFWCWACHLLFRLYLIFERVHDTLCTYNQSETCLSITFGFVSQNYYIQSNAVGIWAALYGIISMVGKLKQTSTNVHIFIQIEGETNKAHDRVSARPSISSLIVIIIIIIITVECGLFATWWMIEFSLFMPFTILQCATGI